MNYQLRKIISNRGHFPNDATVFKLLWLAIRDIEDRARDWAKEKGAPEEPARPPGKLVEGATLQRWKPAAQAMAYPDRLADYINLNRTGVLLTQKT